MKRLLILAVLLTCMILPASAGNCQGGMECTAESYHYGVPYGNSTWSDYGAVGDTHSFMWICYDGYVTGDAQGGSHSGGGTSTFVQHATDCTSRGSTLANFSFYRYNYGGSGLYDRMTRWENISGPAPVADFTGTPTEGSGPMTVSFVDNSSNLFEAPHTFNWSASPNTTVYFNTPNARNTSAIFSQNGNYTITHGVSNKWGSDIETKTDYIYVHNSTDYVITDFYAMDAVGGYSISNASVSLQDIENGTWQNTTSTGPNGKASIVTLIGHHINGYASALGFKDGDNLNAIAAPPPTGYLIMMQPVGYYNVSPGWVTLHVTVYDEATSHPIKGALVSVAKTGGMADVWQTTNDAGIATFPVENQTDVIVRASADSQGYKPQSKSINTGTGNGGDATVTMRIDLLKNQVTATATPTTLPGGGTGAPTTTVTVLPGCEDDPYSPECSQAHTNHDMAWLSENAFFLIELCFIFTALYIMGWKP